MVAITQTAHYAPVATVAYLNAIEREIIAETNRLRTDPVAYAEELEHLKQYFDGKMLRMPGLPPLVTVEGAAPVREAIATLRSTRPLPPLAPSQGMSLAAKDHAHDLARNNLMGHIGSDRSDPSKRLERYGTWQRINGENISYSPFISARWHVLQLLIDDNVPNRAHRRALLSQEYRTTGAACVGDREFPSICVVTYAGGYTEKEQAK